MRLPQLVATILCLFFGIGSAGTIYFTDRGGSSIHRSRCDGSQLKTLYTGDDIPGNDNLRGIVFDPVTDQLYFCDNSSDAIYRASADGTSPVEIVTDGMGFPADITIDFHARKLYWCDRDRDLIERADLDGRNRETIVETESPYFLHVDSVRNKIYWGDFSAGNIWRADLADGANPENLVTGVAGQVRAVQPDFRSGYLYWLNRNDGKIQRRSIEGGPIEDLHTGLNTPHGMILDVAARKIYWADTGTNNRGSGGKAVHRASMDGPGSVETLYEGNQPWDVTMDPRTRTYEEFTLRFFDRDTSADILSPTADPDGDGLENLIEFAFASPPVETGGFPWKFARDNEKFGLSFSRPVDTALTYTLEKSADARTWVPTATLLRQEPKTNGTETVVLSESTPNSPTGYLRIRVGKP